jgi:hypothetical protein
MQQFDHNIGFGGKHQFFRRKVPKIAENCGHNIDPKYLGCKKLIHKIGF